MPRMVIAALAVGLILAVANTAFGIMISQAAFERASLIKVGKSDSTRDQDATVGIKVRTLH